MRTVASFDPAATPGGGSFQPAIANPNGKIIVFNDSPYTLSLEFQDGTTAQAPAYYIRTFALPIPMPSIAWRIAQTLNAQSAPISLVTVEAYESRENAPDINQPLVRQTNVGNPGGVQATTTSIANTGNVAGTPVVSGTPEGAGAAELVWNNDGSGTFGGGHASVDATGALTLPAGAIPAAAVGSGYPAADLSGTLPAANVGNGYPAANLGAGAIPANVTVAGYLPLSGGTITGLIDGTGLTGASALAGAWHGTNGNAPLNGVTQFVATGSGTFSHGLGQIPDTVQVTCKQTNSTQTQGTDTWTSTTVHISSGAGYSFAAWLAYMHYN